MHIETCHRVININTQVSYLQLPIAIWSGNDGGQTWSSRTHITINLDPACPCIPMKPPQLRIRSLDMRARQYSPGLSWTIHLILFSAVNLHTSLPFFTTQINTQRQQIPFNKLLVYTSHCHYKFQMPLPTCSICCLQHSARISQHRYSSRVINGHTRRMDVWMDKSSVTLTPIGRN